MCEVNGRRRKEIETPMATQISCTYAVIYKLIIQISELIINPQIKNKQSQMTHSGTVNKFQIN